MEVAAANLSDGARFLATLFAPGDLILLRPIETWSGESGEKKTRVVYDAIQYVRLGIRAGTSGQWSIAPSQLESIVNKLNEIGRRERANIFFGTCPRFGGKGEFDRAWQIRTIRCLWADLDGTTPESALAKCSSVELPSPSVVVRSGNGVHLYWLLDQPIDLSDYDDKEPLPIRVEYPDEPDPATGKKKGRPYIAEPSGEKTYLTAATKPPLSEKAQQVQDILAGIAKKIGGDHVQDVARILRVPGTMNRKDERNGTNPKPCEIVECHSEWRYPLSMFEAFAAFSDDAKQKKQAKQIRLPPGQKMTKPHLRNLSTLINDCIVAPEGERSERDFRLCCEAVERGWLKEDVYKEVAGCGKFGEGGSLYFERTWAKAEGHTREKILIERRGVVAGREERKSTEQTAVQGAGTNGKPNSTLEEALARKIEFDVMGELPGNHPVCFSLFHRKLVVIHDIDRLQYSKMLQYGGDPIKRHVIEGGETPEGMHSFREVRNAIGYLAGLRQIDYEQMTGAGCWLGIDDKGDSDGTVVLVGNGEGAVVRGGAEIERIHHPRCNGRILQFDSEVDHWYDFDLIRDLLANYNQRWAEQVVEESSDIFGRWKWSNDDQSPMIITGMILSTWVQTIWKWRPMVEITGASNSGKSTLFKMLDEMFGGLAESSSKSSAAGIRQTIQQSGKIILNDEFEKSNERDKILDFVRASSRGDYILMGQSSQRAKRFRVQHCFWVGAIETGLIRAADRNRFITLEMIEPPEHQKGKLNVPPRQELFELGQKLLAIAIHNCLEARELAQKMRLYRREGIDSRYVESYAVPAALLAIATGMGEDGANGLLSNFLDCLSVESRTVRDEEDLLHDILRSTVRVVPTSGPPRDLTVAELVEKRQDPDNISVLARHGIGIAYGRPGPRTTGAAEDDEEFLFIDHKDVVSKLLRTSSGDEWKGKQISAILKRIKGAKMNQRSLGGRRPYGVEIPMSLVAGKFLSVVGDNGQKTAKEGEVF